MWIYIQIFTLFSIDFYEVLETTHNIPTLDINGIKWPGFLNLLFSCHIMLLVSMLRRSLSFTTFWCFTVYHLHETFLLLVMYLHTLFIAESYNKLSLFYFRFPIVSPSPRVHSCPVSLLSFLHTQNSSQNFINLFSVDTNTLNILSTWKKKYLPRSFWILIWIGCSTDLPFSYQVKIFLFLNQKVLSTSLSW